MTLEADPAVEEDHTYGDKQGDNSPDGIYAAFVLFVEYHKDSIMVLSL
jgi:hypothetical protein